MHEQMLAATALAVEIRELKTLDFGSAFVVVVLEEAGLTVVVDELLDVGDEALGVADGPAVINVESFEVVAVVNVVDFFTNPAWNDKVVSCLFFFAASVVVSRSVDVTVSVSVLIEVLVLVVVVIVRDVVLSVSVPVVIVTLVIYTIS